MLTEEGVGDTLIDESVFLRRAGSSRWLDQLQLTTIAEHASRATPGRPRGSTVSPCSAPRSTRPTLTAGAENTVSLGSETPEITVEVENQGDQEESEVSVQYTLSGGVTRSRARARSPASTRAASRRSTMGLDDVPDPGTPLTLEVEVLPVPGEEIGRQQPGHVHGHLRVTR